MDGFCVPFRHDQIYRLADRPGVESSAEHWRIFTFLRTRAQEPLVVVLPSDHRLATHDTIAVQDILGERFISVLGRARPRFAA